MLYDYFSTLLHEAANNQLSESQDEAILLISKFLVSREENEIMILKGYAGTGKTFLMAKLISVLTKLQQPTILLAPTGRAAKVLSTYANKQAYTIHKHIYRQKSASDDFGSFTLDRNLARDTVFIIDEASMIANQSPENTAFAGGKLLDDLVQFIYSTNNNCRLILVGDTAQLPPIGLDISPALDEFHLRTYSYNISHATLTHVIRQAEDSGILAVATQLRQQMPTKPSIKAEYPKLNTLEFPDVKRITGAQLLDELDSCYSNFGHDQTVVITRTNKRANRYNQGIRNTILYREEEVSSSDMIMIVKNNYHYTDPGHGLNFIANGDIACIRRLSNYEELYGHKYADATISLPDYNDLEIDVKLLLDTLHTDTPSLSTEQQRQLYDQVADAYPNPNKRKRLKEIRKDPYYNALQIKFAYAITCHKAQGGQWDAVFLDQDYFAETMLNREYYRWLYTAVTRAKQKLYFVNFKSEFFDEATPEY